MIRSNFKVKLLRRLREQTAAARHKRNLFALLNAEAGVFNTLRLYNLKVNLIRNRVPAVPDGAFVSFS